MRIAIPCNSPGGLEANVSDHFGECDIFTIIDTDLKGPIEANANVHLMENDTHLNCGILFLRLKKAGIDLLLIKQLGKKALQIIQNEQFPTYVGNGTVLQILDDFRKNKLKEVSQFNVCPGKGDCHQ